MHSEPVICVADMSSDGIDTAMLQAADIGGSDYAVLNASADYAHSASVAMKLTRH